MKPILGILGQTGIGKSAVAIEVAKMLNGAVVSCDSMQIFKGLNIGTAKIRKDEQNGVKHFMIDIVEPNQRFSAFDFQKIVTTDVFRELESNNAVPILAGGTGLYFDSVIFGLDFPSDDNNCVRNQMIELYNQKGADALLQVLAEKDLDAYNKIDKKNIKRVIRAIEIAESGQTMFGKKQPRIARFKHKLFVLTRDRQEVYQNIDRRVDKMVSEGLFDEVYGILQAYNFNKNLQSMTAIGYKEVVDFFDGKISKQEAIDAIKLNTRHYAKRQQTYFKRMEAEAVELQKFNGVGEIAKNIVQRYHNFCESITEI